VVTVNNQSRKERIQALDAQINQRWQIVCSICQQVVAIEGQQGHEAVANHASPGSAIELCPGSNASLSPTELKAATKKPKP